MLSEFIAAIPSTTHPQCSISTELPHLLSSPHLRINDYRNLGEFEPEVSSTSTSPNTTNNTPSTQESDSFLDDSFFAVDFPLFDDDGSCGSGSGHGLGHSLGLEFPTLDLSQTELVSNKSSTNPPISASTYIDEENSYLLTSIDDFLAQNTPFDMFLTGPIDSVVPKTTIATTSATINQHPTPNTSPEPCLKPATELSTILAPTTSPISSSVNTSPALSHVLPTPSASPRFNPLKRKSPSVAPLESPRAKELPPIEIHSDDDERDVKRKRNTAAARRYRQKKQDRMQQLEEELEVMKQEMERWKQEAMKQKMEAEKYQALVGFLQNSRQQEK